MTNELPISSCDGCGEPIVWATTERGVRMPVDPDPRPDGNIELVRLQAGVLTARVLTNERREEIALALMTANREHLEPLPLNLYVTHHATCPASEMFGRRRSRHNRALTDGLRWWDDDRAVLARENAIDAAEAVLAGASA